MLAARGAAQPCQARDAQVEALKGEQREEQCRLVTRYGAGQPAGAAGGVVSGKRQDALADVGIVILLVRVGVMAVVLVHPPPEAQAGKQIASNKADPGVAATGSGHLLVSGVVTEERDLRADQPEADGNEQCEP